MNIEESLDQEMELDRAKELYITLIGMNYHYGMEPLVLGSLIYCEKEPGNKIDGEAIRALLPMLGTVAYLANSSHTVVHGTHSAGRIYDKVGQGFYVRILFRTERQVICRVEDDAPELLRMELTSQMLSLPEVLPKVKDRPAVGKDPSRQKLR